MSYTVRRLDDLPVVLTTIDAEFSVESELEFYLGDIATALDASDEQLYLVSESQEFKVNFSDMVMGLGKGTRGASAALNHPKIAEICAVIPDNTLLKLAVQALGQMQYGGKKVTLNSTLEDALAYVREQIVAA